MAAVESLCRRGVVLDQGCVKYVGTQTGAIREYLRGLQGNAVALRDRQDRMGSGELKLVAFGLRDDAGHAIDVVACGQALDICLFYEKQAPFSGAPIRPGIAVKTQMDAPVFLHHSRLTGVEFKDIPDKGAFVLHIPKLPLAPSSYRLTLSLMAGREYIDGIPDAVDLMVTGGDFFGSGEVPPAAHGVCVVDGRWRVESVGADGA